MSIIEMETIGCLIGVLYIIGMFLGVIAIWYSFTFVMWRIYLHNGGKHNFFTYIKIKGLEL